jgi:hypothetical protein
MPMISAACRQVIRFAMARNITSSTFIARSQASPEWRFITASWLLALPEFCLKRTDHVLIDLDI